MQMIRSRFVVVAICLFICWSVLKPARSADREVVGEKWEYLVSSNSGVPTSAELNRHGDGGWELVGVTNEGNGNYAAVFKRSKPIN